MVYKFLKVISPRLSDTNAIQFFSFGSNRREQTQTRMTKIADFQQCHALAVNNFCLEELRQPVNKFFVLFFSNL